jgi:hypothetical protein
MGEEGEATLGKSFTESACRGEVGTEDRRRRRRLGEREGGKKKKGTVEPVYGRRAPYYVT